MTDSDRAREALTFIPASCDRDTWFRVLASVKSLLGEDGREIADEWSATAPDSYDPASFKTAWRSISEGGAITAGTLFGMAKDNGYVPGVNGHPVLPTAEAIAKRDAARRAEEDRRSAKAAEAALKACELWKAADRGPTPYTERKGVQPTATMKRIHADKLPSILGYAPRLHGCDDAALKGVCVVVPIGANGKIASVELIDESGAKCALAGSRKSGGYWSADKLPDGDGEGQTVLIAEGVATALSAFQATGFPTVAAFSCSGFRAVALAMRARYPKARLVIVADIGNGEQKAHEAAGAVGGFVALPDFGTSRRDGDKDLNDLHMSEGEQAVRNAIERASAPNVSTPQPIPENRPDAILANRQTKWESPGEITAPLLEVPAFNPDVMLPDGLRAWIVDEADRMPVPLDFVAAPAITALGSVIGTQCVAKPKSRDDWVVSPNLWGASVGGPSTKKTPGLTAALRPLDGLIAKAIERHTEQLGVYETTKTVADAKREAIEGRLKQAAKDATKGDVTVIADELTRHRESADAAAPVLRRFKSNDSTVEKLGELLRDNPNGLLMLRDEVVGLIASWDREGHEGYRAFFLEAWNGTGSFDTDRIGRGTIFIPNLCVSIYGGIQPDKLTGYLEEASDSLANDGMLPRFQMLVYPDDTRWEWRDRIPVKEARDRAKRIFERLAELPAEAWGANPRNDFVRFPYFNFGEQAQQLFIEWTGELHRRIPAENDPLVAQHLAKFDKLFTALALVFHLVDCADKGISGPITEESALRAAAWCQYLEAHARRCYGLLADKGLRAAQALAQLISGGQLADGFTSRDIRRKQRRHLKTDEAVHAALDWLVDEGWLRPEDVGGEGPGTGRKTVRYHINPRIAERQQ